MRIILKHAISWCSVCVVFSAIPFSALAVTVPFEESFSADASNWKNSASTNPTYVATGGSDGGGYVQTSFAFTSSPSTAPVLFRGHDLFDASGDAFVGDWISAGVTKLRAKVRHNAPQPLTFFARLASPVSFPGAVTSDLAPVVPNTWTEIEFDTVPGSPQFTSFEGSDFAAVFSNIGNVQIGARKPEALANDATPYVYELDQVSIVPEPAGWLLALGLAGGGLLWRRARNAG
jgi:hypothetical protein